MNGVVYWGGTAATKKGESDSTYASKDLRHPEAGSTLFAFCVEGTAGCTPA